MPSNANDQEYRQRKAKVCMTAILRPPLDSRADAKRFFEAIRLRLPSLLPEKIGEAEPLKDGFTLAMFDSAAAPLKISPRYMLFASRKPRRSRGSVTANALSGTSRVEIDAEHVQSDGEAWLRLLEDMGSLGEPVFGFLDVAIGPLVERGVKSDTIFRSSVASRPVISLLLSDLKNGIPEAYWAMTLGPQYTALIGEARLRGAPCSSVTIDERGVCHVRLTDRWLDVLENPLMVERARAAFVAHVGPQFFVAARSGLSDSIVRPRLPGVDDPLIEEHREQQQMYRRMLFGEEFE